MTSNILYKDREQLEENNALYGTNRVRYMPWINRIVGTEANHSTGSLGELSIKEIGYDLAQKFPEDKLAKVIKATSTEIAQAHAIPREFEYNKSVMAVEFTFSNMKNANMTNVEAGILNEIAKQYDSDGYAGSLGNHGVENNPNTDTIASMPCNTIDELIAVISAARKRMKDMIDITDGDFGSVLVGYTSGVSGTLDKKSGDITGRKMVNDTFPDEEFGEIPKFVATGEYVELYYKPMLKMHHGAAPSRYNQEAGKHGLSTSSLFTYESIGIEAEAKGAIVRVPVTFA